MPSPAFRRAFEERRFVVAPGMFDMSSFGRMCELVSFPEVWDLEKRWAPEGGGR